MSLHLVTGYAGGAHVTAGDHGAFNASIVGAGDYVLESGNKLSASIMTNNSIRILDGDLLIQGRHVNLKSGSYEDVTINNGSQGMKRNDIIAVRYEKNISNGVESASFVVLQGTSTSGTAADPELTTGDILAGTTAHEMPLYRVRLNGLNIEAVEPMFEVAHTVGQLAKQLNGWTIEVVDKEPAVKADGVLYFVKKAGG